MCVGLKCLQIKTQGFVLFFFLTKKNKMGDYLKIILSCMLYLKIEFEGRKLVEDTLVWGSSAMVVNIVCYL